MGREKVDEGGAESGSTTVMKGWGRGHFFGHSIFSQRHRLVPLCRLK